MAPVEKHSHQVKRGFKYTYLFAKPEGNKPTLLFFHGFPESKYCWRHQTEFFSAQGYGLIVPDLLGYDETDKPKDVNAYIHIYMCDDLRDVMDKEGIEKAVIIGHDWGVLPAARMLNRHPDRCSAMILMNAGYFPPKGHWTTDKFCEGSKALLGYETMGYFPYYGGVAEKEGELPQATQDITKNIDSFMALMFCKVPEVWNEWFCPYNKAREWIQSNKQGPLCEFMTKEELDHYKTIIHRDIHTNLMWYRCVQLDLQYEPEQELSDDVAFVKQPSLFLSASRDGACQPALYESSLPVFCKDLKTVPFTTGHWTQMEEPDKVNAAIKEFIDARLSA